MAKQLSRLYCTEIKEGLKYFAAWLPNSIFKLGDFGIFEGDCFTRLGNIADGGDLNLRFTPGDKSPLADFTYTSKGVKTNTFDLSADLLGQGLKAGLKIEFSSDNSCFLSLAQCTSQSIANLNAVAMDILSLRERKKWNDEWAVVT